MRAHIWAWRGRCHMIDCREPPSQRSSSLRRWHNIVLCKIPAKCTWLVHFGALVLMGNIIVCNERHRRGRRSRDSLAPARPSANAENPPEQYIHIPLRDTHGGAPAGSSCDIYIYTADFPSLTMHSTLDLASYRGSVSESSPQLCASNENHIVHTS